MQIHIWDHTGGLLSQLTVVGLTKDRWIFANEMGTNYALTLPFRIPCVRYNPFQIDHVWYQVHMHYLFNISTSGVVIVTVEKTEKGRREYWIS